MPTTIASTNSVPVIVERSIESFGATPAQIVGERAMYSNANGVAWAAGTNALATRLQ